MDLSYPGQVVPVRFGHGAVSMLACPLYSVSQTDIARPHLRPTWPFSALLRSTYTRTLEIYTGKYAINTIHCSKVLTIYREVYVPLFTRFGTRWVRRGVATQRAITWCGLSFEV